VDIQAFVGPTAEGGASPAPKFGGKRAVKDDVLKQREADAARVTELSQTVRSVLASVGIWKSDIQIGAELALRGWSAERVVTFLSRDSEVMNKHIQQQLRESIVSAFGTVPLSQQSIQKSLEATGEYSARRLRIFVPHWCSAHAHSGRAHTARWRREHCGSRPAKRPRQAEGAASSPTRQSGAVPEYRCAVGVGWARAERWKRGPLR
jgi:hypothetical protein